MELEDIRKTISYHIDDFNSLVSYCQLNQQTRQRCSTSSFWIDIFNQWGLDLPETLPTNANDWINEFYAIYNTNHILYYLTLRMTEQPHVNVSVVSTTYTFDESQEDLNYYIRLMNMIGIDIIPYYHFTRHFEMHNLNRPQIIDNIVIRLYHTGFIKDKYEIVFNFEKPVEAYQSLIKDIKNYYQLTISFITKEQMTLFLYNILRDHAV